MSCQLKGKAGDITGGKDILGVDTHTANSCHHQAMRSFTLSFVS